MVVSAVAVLSFFVDTAFTTMMIRYLRLLFRYPRVCMRRSYLNYSTFALALVLTKFGAGECSVWKPSFAACVSMRRAILTMIHQRETAVTYLHKSKRYVFVSAACSTAAAAALSQTYYCENK